MNTYTKVITSFAVALFALTTSFAPAQSIRCAQEFFLSEIELNDQPSTHQTLANGVLAVLHQSADVIRFYELNLDNQLELRSAYALYNTSNRTSLHANGNDIYVTVPQSAQPDSLSDLIVLDVQNPHQPELRTLLTVPQSFDYAQFDANTAYFMNNASFDTGNSFYNAYDISNPNNPTLLHRVNMGLRVDTQQGMQISDGLMHLSSTNRLLTYALNELSQTQWRNTINFAGDRVRAMQARDQYVYLYHAGSSPQPSFEIHNFADPANPVLVSDMNVSSTTRVQLEGQYVYLVGEEITVFNVLEPAAPIETATFVDAANIKDLLAHDYKLYVTHDSTISVYDNQIRNLGRPQEVITPTDGQPSEMIIRDQLAYIANGSGGVAIFDVSDPMAPVAINSVTTTPSASDTTRIDANANSLVAVNDNTIEIYSLKSPVSPARIAIIDGFSRIIDIAVKDNTLALMTNDDNNFGQVMSLYDISDPTLPVLVSTTPGFNSTSWLEIHDNMIIAYDTSIPLNDQYTGLTCFDIQDPSNPVFASKILVAQIGRVAYQDGYLYVCAADGFAFSDHAILIYDITDPFNTLLVNEINTGFRPLEIAINEHELVVEANGLYLYDITNPLNPQRTGSAPEIAELPNFERIKPHFVGDAILSTQLDMGLVSYDASPCFTCAADMNLDGVLNFFDVSAFLAAFVENDAIADLNNDTIFNFFDISQFIVSFESGCP